MEHLTDSELRRLYADPALANSQARDKLAAARVWLMKHKPFFGILARSFRLEATLDIPGYRLEPDDRLRFNPIAVLGARFPALCARLAHLSMHAALGSFQRRREREARRWNVACDLAIAPLLEAAELGVGRAPAPAFASDTLRLPSGASAEAYYNQLVPNVAPEPLWCDLCDPDSELTASPSPFIHDSERDADPEPEELGTAPTPNVDRANGNDPPRVSNLEANANALQWKLRLAAAYEAEVSAGGPTFGDVPGWIDELVCATIEPPADWSAVLQQSVHLLQRSARSYLRPSRRMSALAEHEGAWPEQVTMPGRRIEAGGRLVAVIDTSASLMAGTLARFFGALVATATAEGFEELRLVQADASVTRDELVFAAELLFREIEICGRGGTDFGPALRMLSDAGQRQGERFTVVYLTDLDGRFPDPEHVRSLDVLWVVPTKTTVLPPFGRVLELTAR